MTDIIVVSKSTMTDKTMTNSVNIMTDVTALKSVFVMTDDF